MWLRAVQPIVTFHDAQDLLNGPTESTAAGRALSRQCMLFFAQTTDSALATCLVANDPAATWAALKALRPAINKAIEDVARVIGALRLADNDVTEYISHHRAANTQRQDMAPDHHHVQVSTQLQRILQGAEGISELNAICLKYGDINDPTAAALTALFSDIRQHAPSHVAARVQANEQDVCAVCDKRDHNAPECYTRALLFKNGRLVGSCAAEASEQNV
jgi:hypothetical protein